MSNKWYKSSFWRSLVDMHIPDWSNSFLSEFSATEYARLTAISGADTAIIYASNCLGNNFWQTDNAHKGMQGGDFVGERISELKKLGIRIIVYYNIWNRTSHLQHPDWRLSSMRNNSDGMNGRFLRCCINSEGFREYVTGKLEDLSKRYDFDGVWIDMIDWFDAVCDCPSCRRRFFEETGYQLPDTINWSDEVWTKFRSAREQWLCNFLQAVRTAVISIKPSATVTFQNAAWKRGWESGITQKSMDMSEFLAGDFYENPLSYSVTCKFLNNASKNKPIEFMTSICADLSEHTTTKTKKELTQSVFAAVAHNAAFTFIDAIDPVGTMNERRYKMMGEIHREIYRFQQNMMPEARLISDVTFYCNHDSLFEDKGCEKISAYRRTSPADEKMRIFAQSMIEHHIAYDINVKKNLADIKSTVIYISDMRVLDNEEIILLNQFVNNGGTLICSMLTGTMTKDGKKHSDFALAELLGIHLISETTEDIVYFKATQQGKHYFGEYDEGYPVAVNHSGVLVRAESGTEIAALLSLPCSKSDDCENFSSAISNPPCRDTDYPAVTVKKTGCGRAIYLAAPLEICTHDMQKRLLANLIFSAAQIQVYANAPSWLEVLAYYEPRSRRHLIYCYSILPNQYDAEARNVEISLKEQSSISRIHNIKTQKDIAFLQENGYIKLTLDVTDGFAMLLAQ